MEISRKAFLTRLGASAIGGAAAGVVGDRAIRPDPGPAPAVEPIPSPEMQPTGSLPSFSQAGEDMMVHYILNDRQVRAFRYLDVGAHHPVLINNTYFFYRRGHRGVLVEPNPARCRELRASRPLDATLEAGIGTGGSGEADYYVMSHDAWNSFSKEEADRAEAASNGLVTLRDVVKMPLLDINDVLAEHFDDGAPAFVSIDVEGLDLDILKSIDFGRSRPQVFCVETLVRGTTRVHEGVAAFLADRGYAARGGSFVNTIFVDSEILRSPKPHEPVSIPTGPALPAGIGGRIGQQSRPYGNGAT